MTTDPVRSPPPIPPLPPTLPAGLRGASQALPPEIPSNIQQAAHRALHQELMAMSAPSLPVTPPVIPLIPIAPAKEPSPRRLLKQYLGRKFPVEHRPNPFLYTSYLKDRSTDVANIFSKKQTTWDKAAGFFKRPLLPQELISQLGSQATLSFHPWDISPTITDLMRTLMQISNATQDYRQHMSLDKQIQGFEEVISSLYTSLDLAPATHLLIETSLRALLSQALMESYSPNAETPLALLLEQSELIENFSTKNGILKAEKSPLEELPKEYFRKQVEKFVKTNELSYFALKTFCQDSLRSLAVPHGYNLDVYQNLFLDAIIEVLAKENGKALADAPSFFADRLGILALLRELCRERHRTDPISCCIQAFVQEKCKNVDSSSKETAKSMIRSCVASPEQQHELHAAIMDCFIKRQTRYIQQEMQLLGKISPDRFSEAYYLLQELSGFLQEAPDYTQKLAHMLTPALEPFIDEELARFSVVLFDQEIAAAKENMRKLEEKILKAHPGSNPSFITSHHKVLWCQALKPHLFLDSAWRNFEKTGYISKDFYKQILSMEILFGFPGYSPLQNTIQELFGDLSTTISQIENIQSLLASEPPIADDKRQILKKQKKTLEWACNMLTTTDSRYFTEPPPYKKTEVYPPPPVDPYPSAPSFEEMQSAPLPTEEEIEAPAALVEETIEAPAIQEVEIKPEAPTRQEIQEPSITSEPVVRQVQTSSTRALSREERIALLWQQTVAKYDWNAEHRETKPQKIHLALRDEMAPNIEEIRKNPLYLFLSLGNFIERGEIALGGKSLFSIPITQTEAKNKLTPIFERLVAEKTGNNTHIVYLDILHTYYLDPLQFETLFLNLEQCNLHKDPLFLGAIYQQAMQEGVKIESWDLQWAEYHWKDNIERCIQAIHRVLLG